MRRGGLLIGAEEEHGLDGHGLLEGFDILLLRDDLLGLVVDGDLVIGVIGDGLGPLPGIVRCGFARALGGVGAAASGQAERV